jgi:hypothetical protein
MALQTLNRILVIQIGDDLGVIKDYEHFAFLWVTVPQNTTAAGGEVRYLQHLICYLQQQEATSQI